MTISGTTVPDFNNNQPWASNISSIKHIVINSGITSIGSKAFASHTALEDVSFPSSLTTISEASFYGCVKLVSITIPDSVTQLGEGAFADCSKLATINLNEGLLSVGEYAFQSTIITSLALPSTVTNFDPLALFSVDTLMDLSVSTGNPNFEADGAALYNKGKSKIIYYVHGDRSTTEFTIPGTVTVIGTSAFQGADRLTNVTIPTGVKTIEDWAFVGCVGLTAANIPNSVTSIGDGVFQDCTSITSVVVGNGVKSITYRMFRSCTSLTSVTIGTGVEEIETGAFMYCTALQSIVIPEGVVSIVNGAFGACTTLETVTLPSTLTTIGYQVFHTCTSLKNIVLPANLDVIGAQAFYGCSELETLSIPNSVTCIYALAFANCSKLTVSIPENLTQLADGSYRRLDTFNLKGTMQYADAYEVLTIVNQERAKVGLSALIMDEELIDAAMTRAVETTLDFSHTRPSGLDCFSISSKVYGENIAAGSSTAAATMNQWMNSSGHKANILTAGYKSIGVGCFTQGGVKYWVQLFGIGEATGTASGLENKDVTKAVQVQSGRYAFDLELGKVQLEVGETLSVKVTVVNPGWTSVYSRIESDSFSWTSSNASVATISSTGAVTGKKVGDITITCALKSNANQKKTYAIKVVDKSTVTITATKTNAQEKAFTLSAANLQGKGVTSGVRFAVWSDANGQDDLVWYTGSKSGDKWVATADITTRHKTAGRYQVHVYAPVSGKDQFIGSTTFTVTANTASGLTVAKQSDGTYKATLTGVVAPSGVSKVQIAVWSKANQSDLRWYTATGSSGSYTATISLSNHSYNTGTYNAHAYVLGTNQVNSFVKATTFTATLPSVTVAATAASSKQQTFNLSATNLQYKGVTSNVRFAVWSDANGQDDLVWYTGTKSGDKWVATANITTRHKTAGRYQVHVYAPISGKDQFVGSTTFTVTANTASGLTVTKQSDGTYKSTLTGVVAPSGVSKVQIAVWSKANQSDLRWYTATGSSGSYTATISLSNHSYNTGKYNAHAYVLGTNQVNSFVKATTFTATLPSVTVTATAASSKQQTFNLSATNLQYKGVTSNVRFAVWSDTNGQDDLVWYTGTKSGDKWVAAANITTRHKTAGRYQVHVYAPVSGKDQFVGSTTFTVTANTASGLTVAKQSDGTYKATLTGVVAPSGVSKVQIAVWSDTNGQDDLVWYTGTKSGSTYTVTLSLSKHKYNTGKYNAHAYVLGTNQVNSFVKATTFTASAR